MRRSLVLLSFLGAVALTSVLVFALGSPDPALLQNGGFEDGTTGWQALGGELTAVDDPDDTDHVAALTLTSSAAFLYQTVTAAPGDSYRVTGTFAGAQGTVTSVQPSLQAFDGLGGPLQTFAIQAVTMPAQWSFDALDLPCQARTGQVRIAISGQPGSVAYLDDIGLKAVEPSAPCPTETPTATDTLPATETSTPQPTSTPTATRTRTPTRTPALTRTPTSTRAPTSTAQPDVDTPTAETAATATDQPSSTPPPQPTATLTPSNGLLINGSFEAIDGQAPAAWQHFGGELESTSGQVRSGGAAALLRSATTSTKWAYQTVRVDGGAWYQFDAFVYDDDPAVDAAWLRVSWYASDDASGSALATSDSTEALSVPQNQFVALSTGSVHAPDGAHSASVRILLRPLSAEQASIVIDDATFDVAEPATPTPTVTEPPTLTPTPPRPTATPTETRTATATRTITPTRTPAPTGTVTRVPTDVATSTPFAADGATPTATSSGASTELTPTARPSRTPTAPAPTATVAVSPTPSNGLLVNGGFEATDGGALVGWRTIGGALAQVSEPVQSGGYAAAFDSASDSTKWLYQTVPVTPNGWYTFSAYVYDNDQSVDGAFLRASWYSSGDGGGGAISSVDSTLTLSEPSSTYQQLSTGSVQAPPDAQSARVRVMLRPASAANARIVVDDAWFAPSAPADDGGGQGEGAPPSSPGASVNDPDGPVSLRGTSSTGSRATTATTDKPVAFVAQPSPVIRRSSVLPIAKPAPRHGQNAPDRWWFWAIAVSAVGAIAVLGCAAWWRDRHAAPGETPELVPAGEPAYNPPEFPSWEC